VDLWEAGVVVPTAEQLERLAALCHVPVALFFEPPPAHGRIFVCQRSRRPGRRCTVVESPPARPDPPGPVQGVLW
jgi:hypothetical protein